MYDIIKDKRTEELFDELMLTQTNIKKVTGGDLETIYKHKMLAIKHELIKRGHLSY